MEGRGFIEIDEKLRFRIISVERESALLMSEKKANVSTELDDEGRGEKAGFEFFFSILMHVY